MDYLFGRSDGASNRSDGASTPSNKEGESYGWTSLFLVGCGGGSGIHEDEPRDGDEELDLASHFGLCGSGLGSSESGREKAGDGSRSGEVRSKRTQSYDGAPRIVILGGCDKDQVGPVGRELLIPRGALGSVILNNVRPTVLDNAQELASLYSILDQTAAAIISVDVTELYWTVIVRRWADRLRTTPDIPVALLVENADVHEAAISHHVSGLREAFQNPLVGVFFKSPRDETSACVDTLLTLNRRAERTNFL